MGPGLSPSLKLRRPWLRNPGEASAEMGRRDDTRSVTKVNPFRFALSDPR
jgi:hypothetical protein